MELADIIRLLLGPRILGLRLGVPHQEMPVGDSLVPQFEERVWFLEVGQDTLSVMPEELLAAFACDDRRPGLFVDTLVLRNAQTRRPLFIRTDTDTYQDSGGVIHHALEYLQPHSTVAFLAPVSITTSRAFERLRADIDEKHAVTWVIYADGRLLPGVYPAFQFVLLVCEVGVGPAEVTRLVDLRKCGPDLCERELRAAQNRGGGEVNNSVVLRSTRLGPGPWTYERWTAALSASKRDAAELGELRPLRDLVEFVVGGLHLLVQSTRLRFVEDEEDTPPGFLHVIGSRNVRPEGIVLPGRYWVRREGLPEQMLVAEGDLLIRGLSHPGPHGPGVVAAVVPPGLEASFDARVIRLRWKPETTPLARQLLVSWLMSEHASRSLAAIGVGGLHLYISTLLDLEVPSPKATVVAALDKLGRLEDWYRTRAEAVALARHTVFSSQRYAEAIPLLLKTQQVEGERITAAEDSQKFEYRVRNYFPHPIALRRERLQVLDHGKARLEETLECAEHLIHYLALCGLAQLNALRPGERLPSEYLQSLVEGTTLQFSWGVSWSVLKEAVNATRKLKDPLVAPIPQLALLADFVNNPKAGAGKAEADLRGQRNDGSHLHRLPEPELVEMSRNLSAALDQVLEAVAFLADFPLVNVRDYALDGLTGERKAVLDLLRGASEVPERSPRIVQSELPRETLGLLGHTGTFHQLSPWLIMHTCEKCKRPEIFAFNRCQGGTATFVAMETGHAWRSNEVGAVFSKLLAPPTGGQP